MKDPSLVQVPDSFDIKLMDEWINFLNFSKDLSLVAFGHDCIEIRSRRENNQIKCI